MNKLEIAIYNAKGEYVTTCESLRAAARHLDLQVPNVKRAVTGKQDYVKVAGCYVRYVTDVLGDDGKPQPKILLSQKTNTVSTYDLYGKIIETFDDIDELLSNFEYDRRKMLKHINTGSLICKNGSELFFASKGNMPEVTVVKDEEARPMRLYRIIEDKQVVMSSFEVSDIAERLGVTKKLIHAAAQSYRVIGGVSRIHVSEATPLKLSF